MTGTASSRPTRVDFPSRGGLTVAAYRWDPAGRPRAVVQVTHGMGEHAMRYARLARTLTHHGYVVYAQDHRGHGRTAASQDELGRLGEDGWGDLVEDIERLRQRARGEHPAVPFLLLGHSMGSFAVQQYLLAHSSDVDAVVLTGTAVIDLLEPALDLESPMDLSAFNAPFEPARTPYDWLSRDEAEVDAYIADAFCGFGLDVAGGKAMFAGYWEPEGPEQLAGIRADLPVYVAVGASDPVNGELALVHAMVERFEAAGLRDVTLTTYPGARHEVFNETNRDDVVADLLAWADRMVTQSA
jgi:alpha-beta hydrolase superfamily lysophospholipase